MIHVSHFCVIAYLFVYSTYVSEPCYQGMSQIGTIAMHMYLLLVSKCSCWFVFCTRYLYTGTCSQSGHRRHPKHTLTKTEEITRWNIIWCVQYFHGLGGGWILLSRKNIPFLPYLHGGIKALVYVVNQIHVGHVCSIPYMVKCTV